jgi:hypothetical protein
MKRAGLIRNASPDPVSLFDWLVATSQSENCGIGGRLWGLRQGNSVRSGSEST